MSTIAPDGLPANLAKWEPTSLHALFGTTFSATVVASLEPATWPPAGTTLAGLHAGVIGVLPSYQSESIATPQKGDSGMKTKLRNITPPERSRDSADANRPAATGRILARQGPPAIRVPSDDYLGMCSGFARRVRGGKGIAVDIYLPAPRVVLPLFCNLPRDGIVSPTSKLGIMLAVLGIAAVELREDTFTGRWVTVRVRQQTHGVKYDSVIGRRTRVLLPEACWRSVVDEILGARRPRRSRILALVVSWSASVCAAQRSRSRTTP